MHHFVGKDIINFHGLFWPAMLEGAKLRTPNKLYVNGYLGVNGAKMSKSRGTFIQARTYLDSGLNPEYLRYYFATMLGPAATDVDLDLKAFEDRVNSHLVGKWVNIASRCAGFVHTYFAGRLAAAGCFTEQETNLYRHLLSHYDDIPKLYESGEFAEVVRKFVLLADAVNAYIAEKAPWRLAKDEQKRDELHRVCTFALSAFQVLGSMLKPLVPQASTKAEQFLGIEAKYFSDVRSPLYGSIIQPFTPILGRIDSKQIEAMIESSKESMAQATPSPPNPPLEGEGLMPVRIEAVGLAQRHPHSPRVARRSLPPAGETKKIRTTRRRRWGASRRLFCFRGGNCRRFSELRNDTGCRRVPSGRPSSCRCGRA